MEDSPCGGNVSRVYHYSQDGDLIQAVVEGTTTTFVYDGQGHRLQMSVDGEVVTYTLDYAGGFRILFEEGGEFSDTKHYLYGLACLGEQVDADEPETEEWRYYQRDGKNLVRQTSNQERVVTFAWTYSPTGGVLLGEKGPVTYLDCGDNAIYDWSTGLIFKRGRYFDPTNSLWITLSGVVVWQAWPPDNRRQRRQQDKRRNRKWLLLLLLLLILLLAGCDGGGGSTPTPTCTPTTTPGLPGTPTAPGQTDTPTPGGGTPGQPGTPTPGGGTTPESPPADTPTPSPPPPPTPDPPPTPSPTPTPAPTTPPGYEGTNTWMRYLIVRDQLVGTPDLLSDGRFSDTILLAILIRVEFSGIEGTLYETALEALSHQYQGFGCKGACPDLEHQLFWLNSKQGWYGSLQPFSFEERNGEIQIGDCPRCRPDAERVKAGVNVADGFYAWEWGNPKPRSDMDQYIEVDPTGRSNPKWVEEWNMNRPPSEQAQGAFIIQGPIPGGGSYSRFLVQDYWQNRACGILSGSVTCMGFPKP